MADGRKWSNVSPAPDIQDTDEVVMLRGNDNFLWSFLQFRNWLTSFFAPASHPSDSNNPHNVTAIQTGADPTGTASGLVSNHEAVYDHNNIPTAVEVASIPTVDQKAAMDNATTPSAANPFATQSEISAAGEANDGANLGGGVPIFLQKNGVIFEFGTLVSGDGSIDWNLIGNTIDGRASLPLGAGTLTSIRQNSGVNISTGRSRLNFSDTSSISWDIGDDGGANEANLSANFIASHNSISGRSTADAHPISAITGLDAALAGKLDTAHDTDPSAHTGFLEPAGSVAAHDASGAAHGGVEAAFAAHQGAGGTTHAEAVAGGAAGYISGADQQKLDGIEAGAQLNTIDSFNGRTGAVTPSSGDYTAGQVTNALGTDQSSTMQSDKGVAGTTRIIANNPTWTPNPLDGNYREFTQTTAVNILSMAQTGMVIVTVPLALAPLVTFDASWNVEGSPSGLRASRLVLFRNGSLLIAEWS